MSIADNMLDAWLAGFAGRDFARSPIGESERAMLQRCGRRIQQLHARCPVLHSDLEPEHTAARALAYALANGWSNGAHYPSVLVWRFPGSTRFIEAPTTSPGIIAFCGEHALASDTAPLDVLAAIGSFGES